MRARFFKTIFKWFFKNFFKFRLRQKMTDARKKIHLNIVASVDGHARGEFVMLHHYIKTSLSFHPMPKCFSLKTFFDVFVCNSERQHVYTNPQCLRSIQIVSCDCFVQMPCHWKTFVSKRIRYIVVVW